MREHKLVGLRLDETSRKKGVAGTCRLWAANQQV